MLHFLLEKAGPNYLNYIDQFINAKDEMGVTPLYLLCQRGYRVRVKKNTNNKGHIKDEYCEHKHRKHMLEHMVQGVTANLAACCLANWHF